MNVWNLFETGKERDLPLGHFFYIDSLGIFLSCPESKSSLSRQAACDQNRCASSTPRNLYHLTTDQSSGFQWTGENPGSFFCPHTNSPFLGRRQEAKQDHCVSWIHRMSGAFCWYKPRVRKLWSETWFLASLKVGQRVTIFEAHL